MKDKYYKLTTESGLTTLNMADVSAYSVVETPQGMLKKSVYDTLEEWNNLYHYNDRSRDDSLGGCILS